MQDQRPSRTSHFQPPTQPEKVQSPGMQVAFEPQVSPTAQSSGALQAARAGGTSGTQAPSPRRQANPGAQSLSYRQLESEEKTGHPGRSRPAASSIAAPLDDLRRGTAAGRAENHRVCENWRSAPPIRCCERPWWNIMLTRRVASLDRYVSPKLDRNAGNDRYQSFAVDQGLRDAKLTISANLVIIRPRD